MHKQILTALTILFLGCFTGLRAHEGKQCFVAHLTPEGGAYLVEKPCAEVPPIPKPTRFQGFLDTQFGSMSGLGYKFPHLAVGTGLRYDDSRIGFEASADYSPDHKEGFNSGYVVTGGGFGNLWLTRNFGLTAGAAASRLQTPAYQKQATIPQAGLAFRFTGAGFPMRLYTNWIFPTGSYSPATGIEPNRLRGPEAYWETQMYSYLAVGLRFGIFKGYNQGNSLCDGVLGNGSQIGISPCPRGTFTQGITVLYFRFTTKE
jgi:hypothetical protein